MLAFGPCTVPYILAWGALSANMGDRAEYTGAPLFCIGINMKLILALLLAFSLHANARDALLGDAIYYVSNSGNDSNDGLSPGTAWATPQKAWSFIQRNLDFSCFNVRVNVLPGGYPSFVASGALVGACTTSALTFFGDTDHPDRVVITGMGANGITVKSGAWLRLEGILVSAVHTPEARSDMGLGRCLIVYEGARVILGTMAWHVCDVAHIQVSESGELHAEFSNQYITGTSQAFAIVEIGGKLWLNGAWITTLVPQYFPLGMFHVTQLAVVDLSGTILNNIAPVGGPAYDVKSGALLIRLGMLMPGLSRGKVEPSALLIP